MTKSDLKKRLDVLELERDEALKALGKALLGAERGHESTQPGMVGSLDALRAKLADAERKVQDLSAMLTAFDDFEAASKAKSRAAKQREADVAAERQARIKKWAISPETDDVTELMHAFSRDYGLGMCRTDAADRRAFDLLNHKSVRKKGQTETMVREFLKKHGGIPHLKQILEGTWKPE